MADRPKQTYRARYPIADLEPHPENPNLHDRHDIIDESIDTLGFFGAVLVQQSRSRIIAGHGRVEAAERAGDKTVPVLLVDVDDDTALRMMLVDNQAATESEVERAALLAALAGLDDLAGTGFDDIDVRRLAAIIERDNAIPPDPTDTPPPAAKRVRSKPGDVWHIGDHTVVCGDATDESTVRAALRDRPADMVWTDPPYNVGYEGVAGSPRDAIANDDQPADQFETFLRAAVDVIVAVAAPRTPVYVAAPPGPQSITFAIVLADAGLFRQRLVWVKDTLVMGRSDYHYRYEDIYFGYTAGTGRAGRGDRAGAWYGGNAETTVLEYPRPKRSELHPTQKPVELIARCIRNSSSVDALILDPFAGSGSTLEAAHHTGRRAACVELDPGYCDVIVARAAALTDTTPTRH